MLGADGKVVKEGERKLIDRNFMMQVRIPGSDEPLYYDKQMLKDWEKKYPGRIDSMARAMGHITLSHMMDRNLFPFTTIRPTGVPDRGGDKAFDDEDDCGPQAANTVQLRLD